MSYKQILIILNLELCSIFAFKIWTSFTALNLIKIRYINFCLLLLPKVNAQSPHHFNISELYNFKVNTIYNIHQAKNKYAWIGSDQGLYRYSGTDFKSYIILITKQSIAMSKKTKKEEYGVPILVVKFFTFSQKSKTYTFQRF